MDDHGPNQAYWLTTLLEQKSEDICRLSVALQRSRFSFTNSSLAPVNLGDNVSIVSPIAQAK
jgi:hypothetical protein